MPDLRLLFSHIYDYKWDVLFWGGLVQIALHGCGASAQGRKLKPAAVIQRKCLRPSFG